MMASILWYYRSETVAKKLSEYWSLNKEKKCLKNIYGDENGHHHYVEQKNRCLNNNHEFISSTDFDTISVSCIEGLCTVLIYLGVCRYLGRLRSVEISVNRNRADNFNLLDSKQPTVLDKGEFFFTR